MTAPTTFSVNDPITAAWLNNAVDWWDGTAQAYTPLLTASSVTPTQGSGATEWGRYRTIGKQVLAEIVIQFGSSGAAAGSGTYFLSLPVNVLGTVSTNGYPIGSGKVQANGLWTSVDAVGVNTNPTVCKLKYVTAAVNGSYNDVGSSTPGVWTNNDSILLRLAYEAA